MSIYSSDVRSYNIHVYDCNTAPIFDEKTKIWQDYKCSLENFITVVQGRSGKGRVGLDDSEIIQRIMEEIDEPV